MILGNKGVNKLAITITDVAKKAGVSPSTVSRVCKNSSVISQNTKNKVKKAMKELGYNLASPNDGIKNIGIIYPTLRPSTSQNAFYLEVLQGIANFCNKNNISITLHAGETVEEILESIKISPANGFIFLYSDVDDKLINYMYNTKQKFVLIGKAITNINETLYVDTDNVQAGKDATDYLIGLNHKKIAYLGTSNSRVFSSDRKAGYIIALNEANIKYNEDYIIEIPSRVTTEYTKLEELLTKKDRPTAILVCDDILAVSVLPIIKKLNLKVPEDISIVCFNNSLLSKLASPSLTSVDINPLELGYQGVYQLCSYINAENIVATKTLIPHKLIIRDSAINYIVQSI